MSISPKKHRQRGDQDQCDCRRDDAALVSEHRVPDGDDDSGAENNPLIKIDPVPRTGYYTVVVSRYNASAGNVNFILRYGRYNTGNPNCQPPTPAGTKPLGASSVQGDVKESKN